MAKQPTVKYYTSDLIISIEYIEVPKKMHKKQKWTKKEYKDFVYNFLSSLSSAQYTALIKECNEYNKHFIEIGNNTISYNEFIDYVVGNTLDNRQLEQVS
jgi:hypothetical protein